MDHQEGTFKSRDGVELYYQRWRPEGRPRAVLPVVHGFGEHSGRYRNVVNWFVPRGYAVYSFDLRGMGRSPGVRGHVESFAEYRSDVRAFLDLVKEAEPDRPRFLLGHSQGGLIALNYVLHDPSDLDGIIASAPAVGALPVSPVLVLVARSLSRIWPQLKMATGLDVKALSRDPEVVRAYVDDPLVHNLATPRLGTEMMAAIRWTQEHAADLALPLLIVHGTGDRICPCDASGEFFDKVTWGDKERQTYEGYYHEVFNDVGKEMVLADVEVWLDRHLPVRS
ncbi:MAG: lysophospholipase [Anaerolineae bacterium]|nr:lysophospholipase [Anaerolineae bacterium]